MTSKTQITPNATLARESYDEKFDRMKKRQAETTVQEAAASVVNELRYGRPASIESMNEDWHFNYKLLLEALTAAEVRGAKDAIKKIEEACNAQYG